LSGSPRERTWRRCAHLPGIGPDAGKGASTSDPDGRDFEGKRILVTGGTGSLGQVLVRRLLTGANGTPEKVIVFLRDEAKQHYMRLSFQHQRAADGLREPR